VIGNPALCGAANSGKRVDVVGIAFGAEMLRALTTLALLALPGTALAADLVSDPPTGTRTNMLADPGWGFYVQGYGGVVTQTTATFIETFSDGFPESFFDTLSHGPAFGASIGVTTPIDGLSVGLDLMHTHADITDFSPDFPATIDTLSVMGTVEGAYHLTPQFDLYASGGLGAMAVHYADPTVAVDGMAPAYQVAVGLRAKVTDNLSLFTEFKHQDVFTGANVGDPFDEDSTVTIAKANNAVLAGLRFSFD
jgi:opacity protein-like surface antigen